MLTSLLLMYGSVLLGAFLPTLVLILAGKSWGQLPFFYLRIVSYLQSFFPAAYPRDNQHWPAIIERDEGVCLKRSAETSSASFSFLEGRSNPFEMGLDFTENALESIIQDEISPAFDHAPTYAESLLRFSPPPQWTPLQKTLFYLSLIFRVLLLLLLYPISPRLFLLFPVRLALFFSSFVFISLACVTSFFTSLTAQQKTYIGIVYCRLYNAGLGAVVIYRDGESRPQKPGIAVSNHLTPNDIQIIFAGTEQGAEYAYMVTGQKHRGIIGAIETLVSRLCPSLWLERKCLKERAGFLAEVLKVAKEGGPILLFPEGYCTNNTQVLQFRKAVFEAGVDIYPIALKQDARYGDSYWFEDQFHMYLLRLMTSWAVFYEITYLPRQRRFTHESNGQFAARVQGMICETAGLQQGRFDGGFWYKKTEQKKLLDDQQRHVAACLVERLAYVTKDSESSEGSLSDDGFCICEAPKEGGEE